MSMEEDVLWIKQRMGKILGENGIDIIHAGELHEGDWLRIGIIEPSVFSVLETENGNELIEAITFPEGMDIFGKFVGIQLITGVVIAYKD